MWLAWQQRGKLAAASLKPVPVAGGRRREIKDAHVRPRPLDAAWRLVYRLGFPLARVWWRLRSARREGALVAVYVDRALLLVRSSYQVEWNFPGGGAARRPTQRRDVSWARRSVLLRRGCCLPVKPQGYGTGGDTGCTSLNYDWTVCPNYSSTIARSSGPGLHRQRSCAASQ